MSLVDARPKELLLSSAIRLGATEMLSAGLADASLTAKKGDLPFASLGALPKA
jgi:hypothetical protein